MPSTWWELKILLASEETAQLRILADKQNQTVNELVCGLIRRFLETSKKGASQ